MEAYVDDMIVKSRQPHDHLKDLGETFDKLRFYGMRLNPAKCTFGASSGKFLGYLVSRRGIEANPDKVRAIMDMRPPTTVKEVQKLAGRVAALGRFLPRMRIGATNSSKSPKAQSSSRGETSANRPLKN